MLSIEFELGPAGLPKCRQVRPVVPAAVPPAANSTRMPWGRSSKSSKAEEQPVGNPMETQTSDASLEDAAVEIDRQPSATKSTRGGGDAPGIGAVLAG